jgi:hypothetical protein
MNHKDPNLHQLYQSGDQAQPPKSIDDAILARAEQAHQTTRLGRLRPWLAAASILFAVPILWLMLEQPELQQAREESLKPEPVPSAPMSVDRPKTDANAKSGPATDDIYSQDQLTEQGKITVTGSRIKRQDPESDATGLEAPSVAEKKPATSQQAKQETQELTELKAERDPSAEDNMHSSPASYAPTSAEMQQSSESIVDLIEQLKPQEMSETEQALWQDLQRQIDLQQWQQSEQSLKHLTKHHPDIDFNDLKERIKQISKE